MKIAIDARELLGKSTGVGRYLRHILRQWDAFAAAGEFPHELALYAPAACPPDVAADLARLSVSWRLVPGEAGTWWEQVQLASALARDGADVLFAPAYTAPLRASCPVVQTIHDVSFLAHPEWFRWRERVRRSWLTQVSARRARRVLTDSQFSADEIRRLIGVAESRISVIPLGLTAPGVDGGSGSAAAPSAAAPKPNFADRLPMVLYVGSVFNRRHVPELIRSFRAVLQSVPDARLEIVGENRSHPFQDLEAVCAAEGVAGRVGLRAYVTDEELARLYRTARAFAFLSEYEGFGLTPLEALRWGVPAVVLDTAVARETCGPAVRYVTLASPGAISAQLAELISDERAHQAALSEAPAVLARYRWPDAARATLRAIEEGAS